MVRKWRILAGREKMDEVKWASCSDTDAGLAPVTTLSVIPGGTEKKVSAKRFMLNYYRELGHRPNGVAGPQTNPLRNGPVLLLSFGKLHFRAERLVRL